MRPLHLTALALCAVVLTACAGAQPGTPSTSTPATADASADGSGGGDYCAALRENLAAADELAASVGGRATPEVIARVRSSNDAVVASAPPELRADVDASADVTTALLDVLERTGGDFAAAISDPEFTEAVEASSTTGTAALEYNERVCGIDLSN